MSDDRESTGSGGPGGKFYGMLAALAAAGVVVLLLVGSNGGPEPLEPLSQSALQVAPDSTAYAAARGPEDAPVTMMEFADYECSHCATFAALPGPALKRDYVEPGQVRMLVYDFPLSRQSNAIPAALAARCAGDQGRYWEMQGELFSNQAEWAANAGNQGPEAKFADYAREIGLDMDQFNSCYSDGEHLEAIMASRRYGEQLQVRGTPAIFVNGEPVQGYGYETISSRIERELADDTAASAGDGTGSGGSR